MEKVLKKLDALYVILLFASLVTIIACVILQIVSRYGFNMPFTWTEEISLFAFCWFTFTGSASCSFEKTHLEVDFFYNRARPGLKRALDIFTELLILFIGSIMIYDSIQTMGKQVGITSVAARLPIPWYTFAIVLGFIGITVFTLWNLFRTVKQTHWFAEK